MAYDETTAERIRKLLKSRAGVREQKMFGGLAFLINGHMTCGVMQRDLMVRVGGDSYAKLLNEPGARPMDFTGKPLKSMLYVDAATIARQPVLKKWVERAASFAAALPEKPARKAKNTGTGSGKALKKALKAAALSPEFSGFSADTLKFIRGLERNNQKSWFDSHRADYDEFYVAPALAFVKAIGPGLMKIAPAVRCEPRVNGSLFRIQRDVRFSKDKTPYKAHLDLWFWEGSERSWSAPGFFMRILPKQLTLGAGMHGFDKGLLERYRTAVMNPAKARSLKAVLAKLERHGYEIGGATRKSVPRGFDPKGASARLLLHEGLYAALTLPHPKQLSSPGFTEYCLEHFRSMAGVNRWLSDLLSGFGEVEIKPPPQS